MSVRVKVILPDRETKIARLVDTAPVEMLLPEIARNASLRNAKGLHLCVIIPEGHTLQDAGVREGDTLLVYDELRGGPLVTFED